MFCHHLSDGKRKGIHITYNVYIIFQIATFLKIYMYIYKESSVIVIIKYIYIYIYIYIYNYIITKGWGGESGVVR